MAYLDEHPPARSQFRRPRRSTLSGVFVVHTAENTPDHVATDGGAEAVAKFIVGRSDPGSYHDLVDSDSAISLVDYDAEAFHDGTGSNPHSIGLSVATRADVWPLAPQAWRDGAISQLAAAAARAAAHVRARAGIVVPARRITRAESEARVPGFISHAERDPARRHDPGKAFPWAQFLDEYARLTAGTPTPSPAPDRNPLQEDDMWIISSQWTGQCLVDGGEVTWLDSPTEVDNLVRQGVPVRTFVTESNVRRFLSERGANVDELILWRTTAIQEAAAREEQRDLAGS